MSNRCFYPEPKVSSAVVVLDLKEPPSIKDPSAFFKITRQSFEHRRKMLRASLRDLYDPAVVSTVLEKIGQNPLARPENLSLDDFLRLYAELTSDPIIVDQSQK